jgi:hypothetical protein
MISRIAQMTTRLQTKRKTVDHTFTNYAVLNPSPNKTMQEGGDFADYADLRLTTYVNALYRYVNLHGNASNRLIATYTADSTMEHT